jgi:beta-glucanase (GH16 family)
MKRFKTIRTVLCLILAISVFSCSKQDGGAGGSETLPNASIADLSSSEGNAATKPFVFEVALSKSFSKVVTITYKTVDGTAKSGEDYVASEGTLTIQPGSVKGTISINVIGDDIKKGDETFMVRLSHQSNCFLIRETGIATITNDDTKVAFTNNGYDAPTSYGGYTLKWSDEFNGTSLDQNNWAYETGDGCPNLCGFGNNELQYYTNSADNLYFQDGKMIIEARQQSVAGKNYTSARIKTQGKKTFKYGRIDIRAKLPFGKGIWPAFWMLPQNNVYGTWPKSGELDIMELVGHEPNKVHGTLHYGPGPGSTQFTQNKVLSSGTFNDEFHVFSIEWKQDQIQWLIDGNVFSTANKAAFGGNNYPFNEDFYLLFNLAVGGQWPGSPDATTFFPQWLIVDYVRVYQ